MTISNLTLSVSNVKFECENNKNATDAKNEKVTESLISQHLVEMEINNKSCQASINQTKFDYENLKKELEAQKYFSAALETVQVEQEKEIFSLQTALSSTTKNALLCEQYLKAYNISNKAFTISDEMLEEDLSMFLWSCLQNPKSFAMMSVPSIFAIMIILSCFYKYSKKTAKKVKKKVLKKKSSWFPPREEPSTHYPESYFEAPKVAGSQAMKPRVQSSSTSRKIPISLPTSLVNQNAKFGGENGTEGPLYDDPEKYQQLGLNSTTQDQNPNPSTKIEIENPEQKDNANQVDDPDFIEEVKSE